MALGLTQPRTEWIPRIFPGGRAVKAAGALGWQPYCTNLTIVLKYRSLSFLETSGLVQELFYLSLYVVITQWSHMTPERPDIT